jgi:hypothetical protein
VEPPPHIRRLSRCDPRVPEAIGVFRGVFRWHGACYGIAPEVLLPAKGLVAGVIGLVAPLVALSGLAPAAANPVLLVLGAMVALGLSRAPGTGAGRRPR